MRKLSKIIVHKSKEDIIRIEEDRYNLQLENVVQEIKSKKLHMVLLSGPSGSGKTTTAIRLQDKLEEKGIKAFVLSMDNWYKTRNETNMPIDDEGNIDYESPDCIDLKLLNQNIKELLLGKKVRIPHFDFVKQEMVYNGAIIQLKNKTDIIIVEGIHALNSCIDVKDGVRVYISPSDLLIDDKRVLTSRQLRLFRRIIRDVKHRGMTPEATIAKCESVTRGEKLYIEPNKKNIDIHIDSLIGYEVFINEKELERFKEYQSIMQYAYELEMEDIFEVDIPKGSLLEEFYR